MADSLLQAILLDPSIGMTEEEWDTLDGVTKRLLLSELYEALMRDGDIMPTLIRAILQHKDEPNSNAKALFDKLVTRIRQDHERFS
jgi:hypothetical protein